MTRDSKAVAKESLPIRVGDTEWTPRPEIGVYVWKGAEVPPPKSKERY